MAHVYAQAADIQKEFKNVTFSATSTPTLAAVDDMIDEDEAEVDATVGMKYSLPIGTGTRAYTMLRKIVKKLVCGRIKNIIAVKTGSTDANQGKVSDGDAMIKQANDTLKLIRDGEVNLVTLGASLTSSNDGVRSYVAENTDGDGNLDDDSSASDTEDQVDAISGSNPLLNVPAFRRGKVNW